MDKQLLIFGADDKTSDKKVSRDVFENKATESKISANKVPESNVPENKVIEWKIFVDGAARGNPGPSGAGIHILSSKQEIKEAFFLGEKTNNQAEYLALVLALFVLRQKVDDSTLKNSRLIIHSDSELLVRQLCGFYKIKNPVLVTLNAAVKQLLSKTPHKFVHVMREKNKIADRLANEGVDKKKKIPTNFLNFLANLNNADNIVEILKK